MKVLFILALCLAIQAQAELRIGVATTSRTKLEAAELALAEIYPRGKFVFYLFEVPSGVAEQPVMLTWGLSGAKNRLRAAKAAALVPVDLWISMENYIEPTASAEKWRDIAAVVVERTKDAAVSVEFSSPVEFPAKFAREAWRKSAHTEESGWSLTAGEIIRSTYKEKGIEIAKHDWHSHGDFGGTSRARILADAIVKAWKDLPADTCEKIAAGI